MTACVYKVRYKSYSRPPHPHTHTRPHREEEIIMPDEHTGSVKENYQWKVTTHTHTHTRVHEVVPSLTWRTIGKHFLIILGNHMHTHNTIG